MGNELLIGRFDAEDRKEQGFKENYALLKKLSEM